ncbi:MAG: beta-ketoacyl-[acyl-carrier-protein] synthase family protein [Bacteroidota bacterium]
MEKHRVVITGMGVVAPNAVGLPSFETALREARSGIQYLEILEELGFGCRVGGIPPLTEEDTHRYLSDLTLRNLRADGIIYGCVAGMEAWEDAGLPVKEDKSAQPDWDSGCIFGAGMAGGPAIRFAIEKIDQRAVKRLGSTTVQQTMASGISAYLGGMLSLGNLVSSNASACSTGTEAIIYGYERIALGKAERMLCGGCDSTSPDLWAGFDAMRVLNRKFNDAPSKASRPMSASASGFVPGGGAGALVLESLTSARKRNARIYAEIWGGYLNSGGQQQGGTMTAPNPNGVIRCIQGAMADARISPQEIDLISGHLTSTLFDPQEVETWVQALGRSGKDFPLIQSLKSLIGHSLSAAGAIECIAAVLQLHHNFVHPSVNCEDLHERIVTCIDPGCVPKETQYMDLSVVASSSFGFGDVNSCVILGKVRE